jgi:hypothetical protein
MWFFIKKVKININKLEKIRSLQHNFKHVLRLLPQLVITLPIITIKTVRK